MPISFYQARQQILDTVPILATEKVSLSDAAGRAIATDIVAEYSLPAFDNSAMDGYAVRVEDCSIGKTLPVIGYLPAGETPSASVNPGTVMRIMTGAPIPSGADAVIPLENCLEGQDQITIQQTVKKGDHIRWCGEDIRPGDQVISSGEERTICDIDGQGVDFTVVGGGGFYPGDHSTALVQGSIHQHRGRKTGEQRSFRICDRHGECTLGDIPARVSNGVGDRVGPDREETTIGNIRGQSKRHAVVHRRWFNPCHGCST